MYLLTFKRSMTLFICVVVVFAIGVLPSVAQAQTKVSGKMTMTLIQRDTVAIGDMEGHVFYLTTYEGTNVSTGANKFMDDTEHANVSFADLIKGNGPHQGYGEFSQESDKAFMKWQGRITTVSGKDGPIMAFEGTISWISGTGQFENIQGNGTYKGQFISKTTYTVDWEGEYTLKK